MTANGHATSMIEGEESNHHHHHLHMHHHRQMSRENSTHHIPAVDFPAKTPVREYTNIEMTEYPQDYGVNERISNHVNEHVSASQGVRNECLIAATNATAPGGGGNSLRKSNLSQGPIDLNGYVSNGNTRVPPEGMESTCVIVPP